MKALSFKKFSVLGWSDGGVSATILAALYPDSVQKLVIWDSNAYVSVKVRNQRPNFLPQIDTSFSQL